MNRKTKVLVVDDSVFFRQWLIKQISQSDEFEVIGYATDAFDALNKVPALRPDILTLDIEMPGLSGFEFLKKLLPLHPIPVILVSSLNIRVFDALSAGAIDFVQKPDLNRVKNSSDFTSALLYKLKIARYAKVHLSSDFTKTPAIRVPGQIDPAKNHMPSVAASSRFSGSSLASASRHPQSGFSAHRESASSGSLKSADPVIAIGASTGGTEAVLEIVRHFPKDMPGVVITQHMPEGFTSMYAERLNKICAMEVKEAKNGDPIRRGQILIAPGNLQMRVVKLKGGYAVNCIPGEKVSGHRPSVDVLFESTATHAGANSIGVILTGMGKDGAAGLLKMRRQGAFTIGQNQETCVVYGMPMEAAKIGAVCQQASLSLIPSLIQKRLAEGF